ncbi:uncharacterized protein [Ambystoma mexicanum]|uniref:uncharacterized protein isoform X2 n=1 Tax=Ambystoma mexicanum TaxID=8296 RepID=UPI0037E8A05F
MTFIAHPSVRIKGTEHTYNPALCQDEHCGSNAKGQHMHCPFCSVCEAYQDAVILRAHYRVKHVDKGLDFAGLKVIRCCNHCDIVGTIKGEKKFKGAHWHCYCCRNGFNRRDEAVKHYRTHFRNPHTTFQIQVTQDINSRQYYEASPEAHPKAYGGLPISIGTNIDLMSFGSLMAQGSLTTGCPVFQSNRGIETFTLHTIKDSSLSTGMQVGAEETVSVTSPCSSSSSSSLTAHQTPVLMEPDGDSSSILYDDGSSNGVGQADGTSEQAILEKHLIELQQQNHQLLQEKKETEQKLNAEILQLKEHADGTSEQAILEKHLIELQQQNHQLLQEKKETEQKLNAEILQLKEHLRNVVRENVQMSEELKRFRCCDDLERRMRKMVQTMEWQHRELLQMQMAALRKEFSQDEGNLMNAKSHIAQDPAGSPSPSRHKSSIYSENGSSNSMQVTRHSGPFALQEAMTHRQIDLGAGEVISFMGLSGSTSPDDLETMDILDDHLSKRHSQSRLHAASSPKNMHMFPQEAISKELLSPASHLCTGDKRLAGHFPGRGGKSKLQRIIS